MNTTHFGNLGSGNADRFKLGSGAHHERLLGHKPHHAIHNFVKNTDSSKPKKNPLER